MIRMVSAGSHIGFCAFLLLGSVPGSCGKRSEPDLEALYMTQIRIREIRQIIIEFERDSSRLPGTLEEICRTGDPCPFMPTEDSRRGLRDGWDNPFQYRLIDGEYELRSAGKDGRAGTVDDVTFRLSLERVVVDRGAGCYRIDLSWWRPTVPSVYVLGRESHYAGAYRLEPTLPNFYGGYWHAAGQDSVLLEWREQHSAVSLKLRVARDSLTGMAYVPRRPPRQIVALRTACPVGGGY